MNLFAISGLLIGITGAGEALVMFLKGNRKVHYLWGIFCISVMIWGIGSYKIATTLSPNEAILWWRIAYIGVIFIPVFLIHFLYEFLEISRKLIPIILYILGIFFLMLNFINGLFIKEVTFTFNQFYYISSPTIFYILFVIVFFASVFYTLFKFWQAYKSAEGIKRVQIKYMFISLFIGFGGGGISFLPVFKIYFYPYLNITISLGILVVAYAILKYRLMDIRVAIGRGAVYLLSFATVIALALGLMFLNSKLIIPVSFYFAGSIIVIFSLLIFRPVFRFYEKIANRYFYYTFYSSQKVLTDLTKKLNEVLELSKLTSLISDTLINTMRLDKAGILLRESKTGQYMIQKIIGFRKENGISLVKDNFLTLYLEKTKKPIVFEELGLAIRDAKKEEEKEKLKDLRENMKRIEARLCLPLFREGKITGMMVLGNKLSGEPYSKEDMELLENLSNQASIALENANLYAQVQDLSQNLQKKVDEQTKEIREAYEVEKKAHKELKKLDKAKSQFILSTQHHLRTPLTGMLGYLDLIFGGSYGKVPSKLKNTLKRFESATRILIRLVNEFLDISQFQLGREVIAVKPDVQIETILKEIVDEINPEAEAKNLYIKVEQSGKMPAINADPEKLKVALFNIIDNGIKYTTKGGITIKVEFIDSNIRFAIKDTGTGISKEDLKFLFNKLFERGDKADKFYATGRGIGLFISTLIIEAHNGRIWAESKGKDKGSTFYIQIPIK